MYASHKMCHKAIASDCRVTGASSSVNTKQHHQCFPSIASNAMVVSKQPQTCSRFNNDHARFRKATGAKWILTIHRYRHAKQPQSAILLTLMLTGTTLQTRHAIALRYMRLYCLWSFPIPESIPISCYVMSTLCQSSDSNRIAARWLHQHLNHDEPHTVSSSRGYPSTRSSSPIRMT